MNSLDADAFKILELEVMSYVRYFFDRSMEQSCGNESLKLFDQQIKQSRGNESVNHTVMAPRPWLPAGPDSEGLGSGPTLQ